MSKIYFVGRAVSQALMKFPRVVEKRYPFLLNPGEEKLLLLWGKIA